MTREELNKYVEMGDLKYGEELSTERAIAEVHRWIRVVVGESYDYEILTPKVLDMVIQALSTESKWIPVSERLSETGIEVLICDKEGTIYLSHKTSFDSYFDEWGNEIKNVRAWMPLPAPYEESEEKRLTYCSDCIHYKVCGNEGVDDASMTFCADKQIEDVRQMKKVRAVTSIKHSDGDDGRNGFDYIQYNCPKCGNRVIELDIACPACGTFFDWEKIAKIKINKIVNWE